jgi:hypothetical protein
VSGNRTWIVQEMLCAALMDAPTPVKEEEEETNPANHPNRILVIPM